MKKGLLVGGLLLAVLGALWPRAFFPAYWTALMFWTQVSMGCLVALLIQFLTGGRWGRAAFPFLQAGLGGFFVLLPLFVPPLLALPWIFPWTEHPTFWMTPGFFAARSVAYLALLGAAAWFVRRHPSPEPPAWAGPLLVGVVLLLSLASTDWMMSIEPGFSSSIYPFMYVAGGMLAVLAAMAAGAARLWPDRPALLHDFGKLLFAAVVFWGYVTFSQFIIIWTGNLPREAVWYLDRTRGGWLPFTVVLILLHFAVPFVLLLSRSLKKDPRRLFPVAGGLFLVHYLEVFWQTAPRPGLPFPLNPFYPLLFLAVGAGSILFTLPALRRAARIAPEL